MRQTLIPYGQHLIEEDDIAAVSAVLRSGPLTQGPQVGAFEEAIAQITQAQYATATHSGTSALHLALRALDVGPGDRVWTSPISFVASANCALYCGATVDFVDIDPITHNLCPHALAQKLAQHARTHTLPRVLIPVHLSGRPCDMAAIAETCRAYGVAILEDASHALGATYNGKPIGACVYSDMTVFSFHPVKMITTGEGGLITTNNPQWKNTLDQLRSHGVTRDQTQFQHHDTPDFYYEQQHLGYNYRMCDLQAALGRSQVPKLQRFLAQRRQHADTYHSALAHLPVQRPPRDTDNTSSWHLYVITFADDSPPSPHVRSRRDHIYYALQSHNIMCSLHYYPIHCQPYYQKMGFQIGDFPHAERYGRTALTLPLFVQLTTDQITRIVEHLTQALNTAPERVKEKNKGKE
ncbi:MAG: UDP-4-amino-4,6-dideoxy-N-acetyl-beta-L-altrosamine transaminase [Gammaproteobacteria bacterium]